MHRALTHLADTSYDSPWRQKSILPVKRPKRPVVVPMRSCLGKVETSMSPQAADLLSRGKWPCPKEAKWLILIC
jgi:hypothetical protein